MIRGVPPFVVIRPNCALFRFQFGRPQLKLFVKLNDCENGKPVPVDRADWQQYVQGLVEVGRAAYRASQTRNQEAVGEVTNQISDACANCHRVYRDRPTAATRCTPQ